MRKQKYILLSLLTVFIFSGCETCKGMKKDATHFVDGFTKEDGWINKSDQWMRENMW
jgi:hypothetical protein